MVLLAFFTLLASVDLEGCRVSISLWHSHTFFGDWAVICDWAGARMDMFVGEFADALVAVVGWIDVRFGGWTGGFRDW